MNRQESGIDVKNLCSRKLLEMLINNECASREERQRVRRELAVRRHYCDELASIATDATETRH